MPSVVVEINTDIVDEVFLEVTGGDGVDGEEEALSTTPI